MKPKATSATAPRRILHMTLKREWFDQIAAGTKKEEYRELKPYWRTRMKGREYDEIHFRNGYNADAPRMRVEYRGLRKDSRNDRYVIRLGKVLELKRPRKK